MFRSCRRLFLFVTTVVAAWVLVSPAWAGAPLCDDRGAITFAPAPQLQAPETSLDIAADDDTTCVPSAPLAFADGTQGHAPPAPASAVDPLAPVAHVISAVRVPTLLGPGRWELGALAASGVRSGVERPPRA